MTVTIKVGHVLDELAKMPPESVHCIWTSVPYWGLRSYGTEPQIWGGDPKCEHEWGDESFPDTRGVQLGKAVSSDGRGQSRGCWCRRCGAWRGEHGLEPTLDLWLTHEVAIFREVRRVLRDDGVVFINCGDAYATTPNSRSAKDQKAAGTDDRTMRDKPNSTIGAIFKPKDRLLMPHRLAIALQADGWWIRDEVVLHKLNPMPSSVKDRTCPAHEFLFMLSKKAKYYYDPVATLEKSATDDWDEGNRTYGGANKGKADGQFVTDRLHGRKTGDAAHPTMRLKRSVWSHATEPFPAAHFAAAPTAWVRPCILAGTSAKGVCPKCGAPWVRETSTDYTVLRKHAKQEEPKQLGRQDGSGQSPMGFRYGVALADRTTTGWSPSCTCPDNAPVPATILDPFGGAGTTGLVADELGRDAILIELKPEYAAMARDRLRAGLARVDTPSADAPLGGLFA